MASATQTDLGSLSEKQREAVVSEDKRILVLAGAGSGKTKTLLQKLIYLIEEKGVNPSNILAITFTKNATNEMIDRLIISADNAGYYEKQLSNKRSTKLEKDKERFFHQKKYKWIDALTVKTFHSFCYSILRNYGVNEFDNKFRIIGDEKRDEEDELTKHVAPETVFDVVHKLLIEECEDIDFLLRLKRYILDYIVDKIHLKKNDSNFISKDGKYFTALDGTKVRSKSEQFIADWFYRHSIKYEYEPLLNVKDFYFHPDFHVPAANLYIEHVSEVSFPIKDKEEQFEKGHLLLVKTFESMTKDSALFNHTLDKILKNRLPAEYHKTASLTFREEFNGYHEDMKDFVHQIMRITDMIKVENINIDTVLESAAKDQHERVRHFYELAIPILKKYIHYCIDKSYLDFNDLISRSASLFQNHTDIASKYQNKYQYILVDEFQDVNNLQVELIKLLLTDHTQLFCVGDDWQSIYGFRGSNVSYIVDFEKHFTNAKVVKLNLNYRSTQNIVGASNEVIKHNKFKVEKDIQASKKSEHKIVIFSGGSEDENIQFCADRVQELLSDGLNHDDILFLYRRSKMYTPYFIRFRNDGIVVSSKTIHSAKGLESKVVFIIGLTEGNGGFPEWEFGGYPWWLLKDKTLKVRSKDPKFLKAYHDYVIQLGKQLDPLLVTHGGNILMVQIENEYGSYSNDKEYLDINRKLFREAGFDCTLFTCDGPSQLPAGYLPGYLPAVNGLDNPKEVKALVNKYHDGKGPYYIAEWYPGWFDSWGSAHSASNLDQDAGKLDTVLAAGLSINLYMFHGGTTRGFMNGANMSKRDPYSPQTSSYDYDAPLDEAGNTTPKYFKFREIIQKHLAPGVKLPPVPENNRTITIKNIKLASKAPLFANLPAPVISEKPLCFEDLNQGYGFVLYRTILKNAASGLLKINGMRDFATVYLNGERVGILDRRLKQDSLIIGSKNANETLDILVENNGRINYGPYLIDNRQGITGEVTFHGIALTGWKMYKFPFNNMNGLNYIPADTKQIQGIEPGWHTVVGSPNIPSVCKGAFNLTQTGDTYLDMSQFGKGFVFLNGHNLGKYWYVGPQQTLYVPALWLKKGQNEIVVFDELKGNHTSISALDKPILNTVVKE